MQAKAAKPMAAEDTDPGVWPEGKTQLVLNLGHVAAQTAEDFMVCEGNRLAFEHICAFPDWSAPMALVEGAAKAGKSHLARIWLAQSEAVVVTPDTAEMLAAQGGTRPVLVEDVDRAGYDEVGLFHLLNQSMREARPLLMTARVPIADWPYRTNDLKSRARLAAWFSLTAPDDILLSQMMVKLFADRQLSVDPKVISYLVARMERSSEEVVALVSIADRLALSRGRAVTRAIALEALALRAAGRDADTDREG